MSDNQKSVLGWREWAALPELEIPRIKAKIDTGARTSALHTFELETMFENGIEIACFKIHPEQKNTDYVKTCKSPVLDRRVVSDSGGHKESRIVIETPITIGERTWSIEITLTNRENMQFRMLLGRTAMTNHFVVDPALSYLQKDSKN